MTSNYDFYFGLLRVSIIQLLKSHGFDRARPTTIDVLADLYIKYLGLLITEVIKLTQSRMDQDETVALQDISLAFQNLGIIKPMDVLDVYDENPELPSDAGMRKFKDWCIYDHQPEDARTVALPTGDLLKTGAKHSKPLSLIPDYINQLQHEAQPEDPKAVEEDDELVEELINNGDLDDWIRFVFARQRITLARKLSGKEPRHMALLPSIGGLKHSVLENQHGSNISNNQLLPNSLDASDGEVTESLKKGDELIQKLPIMRPEWKLENVVLSYENEDEDINEDKNESVVQDEPSDIAIDNGCGSDFDSNGDENTIGGFTLDANTDTQFAEIEDMNNTFQRRESLDFGDQEHNLKFDFNEF